MKTIPSSSFTPRVKQRLVDAFETLTIYLFAILLVAILTGCGGGGDGDGPPSGQPPAAPSISSFAADQATYFVGDQPTVTAVFGGGTGRIVNLASPATSLPVTSNTPIRLPKLSGTSTYRLIVETASNSVNRDLELVVAIRGRYTPLTDRIGASGHESIAMPDGSALVTGGSRGEGVLSNAIERLDPTTNRITRVGSLLSGRERHQLAALNDGDVLVVGGQVSLSTASSAELISGKTWQSSALPSMTTPRTEHTATTLQDGRVLVVGGITAEQRFGTTAEIYDPTRKSFSRLATTMSTGRTSHTALRLKDGRVLIVGGYSNSANYAFIEAYVPSTGAFVPIASPVASPRANVSVQQFADGRVYIAGGDGIDLQPTAQVLVFDPTTNAVTVSTTGLPAALSLSRSVVLPDGRMGLFGGIADVSLEGVRAAYALGRSGSGSVAVASLPLIPDVRVLHTATRLADGRTLIVGGQVGFGFATTPYLFD
jgi:Galactose oxidase, central domain